MLELAEEALDQIALAVDAPVNGTMDQTLAGRRDVSLGAACPDQVEQSIGVIATVGDDMAALQPFEQMGCGTQIVGLPCGEHEPDRQTVLVNKHVDLGAQSSTRTADGVIFAPFLPPAACWWARMTELSMKAIEWGDFAASVSNIRTQTPALAQRLKRL